MELWVKAALARHDTGAQGIENLTQLRGGGRSRLANAALKETSLNQFGRLAVEL
ncbi:MAG TPA: hypothetical protein VGO93_27865 [Candidatus Xenobia bacterium]